LRQELLHLGDYLERNGPGATPSELDTRRAMEAVAECIGLVAEFLDQPVASPRWAQETDVADV
jgi:hypothetical protein